MAPSPATPYVRPMTDGSLPPGSPGNAPGEAAADDLVAERLYQELRILAHRVRVREGEQATFHTTELVHEAYLRLADDAQVRARGTAYFFGAAAQAMRRILVDAARRRRSAKRGGAWVRVTLAEDLVGLDDNATELLDLDQALRELEGEFPRLARGVELRFFGGLTVEETAETLGVSPRTVKGDWVLARAWLLDRLSAEGRAAPSSPARTGAEGSGTGASGVPDPRPPET